MPPRIDIVVEQGGAGATSPMPSAIVEALDRIEVRRYADAPSRFSLAFAPRIQGADLALITEKFAQPFARVVVKACLNVEGVAETTVLIDGLVTAQDYTAPTGNGAGSFTITGEDASVRMDMVERSTEYPALSDGAIVSKILSRYAALVDPAVTPPDVDVAPTLHVPQQNATDLAYLRHLARRHGAVFRIEAGASGKPVAYWGPPKKAAPSEHALTVGAGSFGNVAALSFQRRMLAPSVAYGAVLDVSVSPPVRIAVAVGAASHVAGYAASPALTDGAGLAANPEGYADNLSALMLRGTLAADLGPDATSAQAVAQGMVDASATAVVTATGSVDTAIYGALLLAPGAVQVRGAGTTFDGTYALTETTHVVEFGDDESRYTQSFVLAREGTGATASMVTA